MPRPLYEIANEIETDWTNVNYAARPYLNAMKDLISVRDKYYEDSALSIILYFLSNSATWRGETAKRIKDELRKMVDTK